MCCRKEGVWSGIVQTQQHQKNVTDEKESAAQSHYLQNKTPVSNQSIPHPLYSAVQQRIVSTEYQPFTMATELAVSIIFTIATGHVNISP